MNRGLWMSVFLMLITNITLASNAPYPQSQVITGMTWDLSTVTTLRKAQGSDLWPMTWAADGNLYGAWGDGGGFDGNANNIGRVSLGFARITGTPVQGQPNSFSGKNVWGAAPGYAQYPATFGGKVGNVISIDGVLYGQGGLWTTVNCGCADPTQRSGSNPTQRTLIWSEDLGKTWTIAPWTVSAMLGAPLQFGQDYRGAWDPAHVYLYYQRDVNVDASHVYLRRVRRGELTTNPSTPGHYEYWAGPDAATAVWSTVEANAVPVFHDANIPAGTYAGQSIVYAPALGRYLLTTFHGNGAGQVGFFEAPHPWGPWATLGYYSDWGGYNETAGEGNGLSFPAKWISADGKGLWAVFSGLNAFDSFNVARVTLSTNGNIPQIVAPSVGAVLAPGATITAQGSGAGLSWSVDVLNDGGPAIASGSGSSIRFVVPSNATAEQTVRITLTGSVSTVYRDYAIAGSAGLPNVTIQYVATGKTYAVTSAQVGKLPYIDRTYTLTALSTALNGARLIQTANDDKFATMTDYLEFNLDRAATVYVCYSKLATTLPAWLTASAWSLTSETCEVNDDRDPVRAVYRRAANAGLVTLGGNRAPPAASSANFSNYIVMIK